MEIVPFTSVLLSNKDVEKRAETQRCDGVLHYAPNREKIPASKSWKYFSHDSPRSKQAMVNFDRLGVLPCVMERMQVAQYIKRGQINAMISGNYQEAEYFQSVCDKYMKACSDVSKKTSEDYMKLRNKAEIEEINNKLSQINRGFDQEMIRVKAEAANEMLRINVSHQNEISTFVEKWGKEEMLNIFSRPSPFLLQLRERERCLVVQKNFLLANNVKQMADELEEKETMSAQMHAEATLQKERDKMETKYMDQIESLNKQVVSKCEKIELKRREAAIPYNCRKKKLENDLEQNHYVEPKETVFDIESKIVNQTMPVTTPRTREKLEKFKKTPKPIKLCLNGMRIVANSKLRSSNKIHVPQLSMN